MTIANPYTTEARALIAMAFKEVRSGKFDIARSLLHKAAASDDCNSKVQNLLGAISEFEGDRDTALRHYRAAYALNPSNRFAIINIERLTYLVFQSNYSSPLLGDEDIEDHRLKI